MNARLRLEAYLRWKGWSQSEFARAAGLHQTTISKLLAEQRAPGLLVAHAIERVTADGPDGPVRTEEWVPPDDESQPSEPEAA